MIKNMLTPEEALDGIHLALSTADYDHVLKQLRTWPPEQIAALLVLEAFFQRNRLLKEKEERRTAKKGERGER